MKHFNKANHKNSTGLITFSAVVAFLAVTTFAMPSANSAGPRHHSGRVYRSLMATAASELLAEYHGSTLTDKTVARARANEQPGIHESIPTRYLARYQNWKREFLATETGRQQWA